MRGSIVDEDNDPEWSSSGPSDNEEDFEPHVAAATPLPSSSPLSSEPPTPTPVARTTRQLLFTPTKQYVDYAALSSSGPVQSSPVQGATKAERTQSRRKKAAKKQSSRMRQLHAERRQAVATAAGVPLQNKDVPDAMLSSASTETSHPHAPLYKKILRTLRLNRTSFRDLFFFIMDPKYKQGRQRRYFLGFGDSLTRALHLIHRASKTIHEQVECWATDLVSRMMKREARTVTTSKVLQTHHLRLDGKFFLNFALAPVKNLIAQLMPTTTSVFTTLASNPKYAKKHSDARQARRSNVIYSTILQGLSEWSQSNNLFKKIMSLYLYATGAQRQQIEVLSHLGITQTYQSLVDKRTRKKRKKKTSAQKQPNPTTPAATAAANVILDDISEAGHTAEAGRKGTLHQLSHDMKSFCQLIAAAILFGATYDNVNIMSRVAEQIVGRKDSQENGTCATIFPLFKASLEEMKAETLIDAFDKAPALTLANILHTPLEAQQFRQMMIYTILRIIILEGGDQFKPFREVLIQRQPATDDKIELHQTDIHPTPAWKIDQSTITGNAEFIEVFYEYLGIRTSPTFSTWVRLIIGDQLSIARLRSLLNIRAGQEGGAGGFRNFVLVPGLFHAKITDTHGFFATHWGKPGTGNRVPGSLWYHNTLIHRLPITLTSLPPFRTCRDLIWISLYSRVLDCFLLVTEKQSVNEAVTESTTVDQLLEHATTIYDRFVDVDAVESLRAERAFAVDAGVDPKTAEKGDMVFENAVLFLRDALISREYADAVKCGDSGRVMLVLKIWALSYRGSGRSKYAYEMLSLIHHVAHVWPKPIVKIVFNNWLVNTTGNPNSFLEGDLLQEHMNFWIKNFYHAHGSNASWEWLEMLAPCVVVLRNLTKSLNGLLGADLGTKHKSPDHSKDLAVLMIRLRQYDVHKVQRGRVIDENDGGPVTDVISAGLASLTDSTSNPLDEYNTSFQRLQRRCRLPVLVPQGSAPSTTTTSQTNFSIAALAQDLTNGSGDPAVEQVMDIDGDAAQDDDVASEIDEPDDEGDFATLTLDTADDVALDMDEMGFESDKNVDDADDNSSEEED